MPDLPTDSYSLRVKSIGHVHGDKDTMSARRVSHIDPAYTSALGVAQRYQCGKIDSYLKLMFGTKVPLHLLAAKPLVLDNIITGNRHLGIQFFQHLAAVSITPPVFMKRGDWHLVS